MSDPDTIKDSAILQGLYDLYEDALDRKDFVQTFLVREEIRKLLTKDGPLFKIEDKLNLVSPFSSSED
jgi:hypothetical protein